MATLVLVVGLPGAGKTSYARRVAAERPALRLTPDEWMIPLFGTANPPEQRALLEGLLIGTALDVLARGQDVVLDFGFWGRDERASLRSIAASRGAASTVVYLPIDPETQRERIGQRWAATPDETFVMTDEEMATWRAAFEEPDAAELAGCEVGPPPSDSATWAEWASTRWPSLAL